MNSKILFVIVASAAIAIFITLVALDRGQQKISKPSNSLAKSEACNNDLTVELLGGIELKAPRNAIILKGNQDLQFEKQCEIERVTEVRNLRWIFTDTIKKSDKGRKKQFHTSITIASLSQRYPPPTSYRQYKKLIDEATDLGALQQLSSNMYLIDNNNSQLFMWKGGQTKNGEPITVYCSGSLANPDFFPVQNCHVAYIHPEGFYLSFSFSREMSFDFPRGKQEKPLSHFSQALVNIIREKEIYIESLLLTEGKK